MLTTTNKQIRTRRNENVSKRPHAKTSHDELTEFKSKLNHYPWCFSKYPGRADDCDDDALRTNIHIFMCTYVCMYVYTCVSKRITTVACYAACRIPSRLEFSSVQLSWAELSAADWSQLTTSKTTETSITTTTNTRMARAMPVAVAVATCANAK